MIAVIFLASCSSEKIEPREDVQTCDVDEILNYPGTACCVTGKNVADRGDILTYRYHTNLFDPKIEWTVVNGDLSILGGTDEFTVTVQIGESFTSGTLRAFSATDNCDPSIQNCGSCSDSIDIEISD